MQSYDIKRERRALYASKPGRFEIIDVPTLTFLMVDGHGDPNTSTAYRDAVEALYPLSYAVRAVAKTRLDKVHVVGPLEGLWSAVDLSVFHTGDKSAWDWTLMIVQPDWIAPDVVEEARAAVQSTGRAPSLERVRFESYSEGLSVQTLHLGPYDDEGPTIERLHDEFLPANALTATGRHHEIYLSDPRKTAPARLRTILRQPVRRGR